LPGANQRAAARDVELNSGLLKKKTNCAGLFLALGRKRPAGIISAFQGIGVSQEIESHRF
jgi:hypothetical protein